MPWQKVKQLFKGKQLRVRLEEADVNRIVDSCSLSPLLERSAWNSECFLFREGSTAYDRGPNVMDIDKVSTSQILNIKSFFSHSNHQKGFLLQVFHCIML